MGILTYSHVNHTTKIHSNAKSVPLTGSVCKAFTLVRTILKEELDLLKWDVKSYQHWDTGYLKETH